ncbi:hypothetical protein HYH03_001998 [Edaphochlamys debaryana]|uniref:SRCR domain-containing protein n=1 Tax=Edaphochlamys debaryana TaxID=47281 RepID=A0A835YER6_9CHLO|nr:hypothetical protein HYH03_001998 [Edaphochlamys debaryana]|eukprot:KAG2500429.1 hypothetical protein HYH03_001998 [Edaphochlamys debaryana]
MASARAKCSLLLLGALCVVDVRAASPPPSPNGHVSSPSPTGTPLSGATLVSAFTSAGLDRKSAQYCATLTVSLDTLKASLLPALERTLNIAMSGLPRSARRFVLMPAAVEPCRTLQSLYLWGLESVATEGLDAGCFAAALDASNRPQLQATADVGLVESAHDTASELIRLSLAYCNGDIPGDWGQPYGDEFTVVVALASAEILEPLGPRDPTQNDGTGDFPPEWFADLTASPSPSPSTYSYTNDPFWAGYGRRRAVLEAGAPAPAGAGGVSGLHLRAAASLGAAAGSRALLSLSDGPMAAGAGTARDVLALRGRALLQDRPLLRVVMVNASSDMGGRVLRGRPEVSVLPSGPQGAICDDAFAQESANVLCHQLGYDSGAAYGGAVFGEATSSFLLDELNCTGTETNVGQCPANPLGTNDCFPSEAAGLLCYPVFNETAYCSAATANISRFSPTSSSRTAPTASRCAQLLAIAADVTTLLGNAFPGMPVAYDQALQLPCFNGSVAPLALQWLSAWRSEVASAGCQLTPFMWMTVVGDNLPSQPPSNTPRPPRASPGPPPPRAPAPPPPRRLPPLPPAPPGAGSSCPARIAPWPTAANRAAASAVANSDSPQDVATVPAPTTYMDLSRLVPAASYYSSGARRSPLDDSCTPTAQRASLPPSIAAAAAAGLTNVTSRVAQQAAAWLAAVNNFKSLWSPRDLTNATALASALLGRANAAAPSWLPARMTDIQHLLSLLEAFSCPGGIDLVSTRVLEEVRAQIKNTPSPPPPREARPPMPPRPPPFRWNTGTDSKQDSTTTATVPALPPRAPLRSTEGTPDDKVKPPNPSPPAPSPPRPFAPVSDLATTLPLQPVCVSYDETWLSDTRSRTMLDFLASNLASADRSWDAWGVPVPLSEAQLLYCERLQARQAVSGVALTNMNLGGDAHATLATLLRPLSNSSGPALPAANLAYLDLSGNALTGPVPRISVPVLHVNLSYNDLGGSLRDSLVYVLPYDSFATTLVLDLSSNSFTGPLPTLADAATNGSAWRALLDKAVRVDMSANNLEGTLPADWAPRLATLDLVITHNPRLTGAVPREWIDAANDQNSARGGPFVIDLTGCSGLEGRFTSTADYNVLRTRGTKLTLHWRSLSKQDRKWAYVANRAAAGHMDFEQVDYKQPLSAAMVLVRARTIDSDDVMDVCSALDRLREQERAGSAVVATGLGPWPRERTYLQVHESYTAWQTDPAVWCYGGAEARGKVALKVWLPAIILSFLAAALAVPMHQLRRFHLGRKAERKRIREHLSQRQLDAPPAGTIDEAAPEKDGDGKAKAQPNSIAAPSGRLATWWDDSCDKTQAVWDDKLMPVWDVVHPRLVVTLYWIDIISDIVFVAGYKGWDVQPAPAIAVLLIILANMTATWIMHLMHLRKDWGWSRLKCILVGIVTAPFGMVLELVWNAGLTLITYLTVWTAWKGRHTPEGRGIHVDWAERLTKRLPKLLLHEGAMEIFEHTVLLEPLNESLPQAIVQTTGYVIGRNAGMVILTNIYLFSAILQAINICLSVFSISWRVYQAGAWRSVLTNQDGFEGAFTNKTTSGHPSKSAGSKESSDLESAGGKPDPNEDGQTEAGRRSTYNGSSVSASGVSGSILDPESGALGGPVLSPDMVHLGGPMAYYVPPPPPPVMVVAAPPAGFLVTSALAPPPPPPPAASMQPHMPSPGYPVVTPSAQPSAAAEPAAAYPPEHVPDIFNTSAAPPLQTEDSYQEATPQAPPETQAQAQAQAQPAEQQLDAEAQPSLLWPWRRKAKAMAKAQRADHWAMLTSGMGPLARSLQPPQPAAASAGAAAAAPKPAAAAAGGAVGMGAAEAEEAWYYQEDSNV